MFFFIVVLACFVGVSNGTAVKPLEFLDFIKKISIPAKANYNVHSKLLLADPAENVSWKTKGVSSSSVRGLLPGAGSEGRCGEVFLRFNGKSLSKSLEYEVVDNPWSICWVGTFNYVNEVHLSTSVDMAFYIDVDAYLQKKKVVKALKLPETSKEGCSSFWYEVLVPGYKPLWMHVNRDFGMHYGVLRVTFVYEKPEEDNTCDILYPEGP